MAAKTPAKKTPASRKLKKLHYRLPVLAEDTLDAEQRALLDSLRRVRAVPG